MPAYSAGAEATSLSYVAMASARPVTLPASTMGRRCDRVRSGGTSTMNRTGTSRGSSWYGISETSRAPGQPMTAAKRLLSSVML